MSDKPNTGDQAYFDKLFSDMRKFCDDYIAGEDKIRDKYEKNMAEYFMGDKEKDARIAELERTIEMCCKDMYSATGKISKKTAIELMKYAQTFEGR